MTKNIRLHSIHNDTKLTLNFNKNTTKNLRLHPIHNIIQKLTSFTNYIISVSDYGLMVS